MRTLCKALLPLFALVLPLAVTSRASAWVSDFQIYSVQNYQGGAVMAHGSSMSVVSVAARVTCSNTGLTPHYGPRVYVAFDPSQYVCAAGAHTTSVGFVDFYS